jgi:hypothetical protein
MAKPEKDNRDSAERKADDEAKADEKKRITSEARAARILAADRPETLGEGAVGENEKAGAQTRGGARLQGSSAERGELIGMRRGIPIYATAESLYGAPKELAPAVAAQEAIPAKDKAPAQAAVQEKPAVIETLDQQRAAHQAREAPRAAAMQVTPESRTYFSPAFAREMDAAREKENALAKRGGAAEVARRETEKAAYTKFESDFVQSTGRENARQQIAAGTASPELIAKYPELNPLRSIAKPGDNDYEKTLSELELETVNRGIFKPSAAPASAAPQAGVTRKRGFARGKR